MKNYTVRCQICFAEYDFSSKREATAREKELQARTPPASILHRELEKVSDMLDYFANAPKAGIELTAEDIKQARAQLKVAKYILKTIKP